MLKIATAAVIAGFAFPAYADTDHTTVMGCYASVHSQCYGDNGSNCSDEVYQGGLDECDSSYGNTAEIRPTGPGRFLAPTGSGLGFLIAPRTSRHR